MYLQLLHSGIFNGLIIKNVKNETIINDMAHSLFIHFVFY